MGWICYLLAVLWKKMVICLHNKKKKEGKSLKLMTTGWLLQCRLGCTSVIPSAGTHLSLGSWGVTALSPPCMGSGAACPLWGAQGHQCAPQGLLPAAPGLWGVGSLPSALPIMGMGWRAPAGAGGTGESSAGHQGPSPPHWWAPWLTATPPHLGLEMVWSSFWFKRNISDPILRLWVSKWALKAFMSQQCRGQSSPTEPHRGAGCLGGHKAGVSALIP